MKSSRTFHLDDVPLQQSSAWDEFVRSRADSTFCHLYGWRAIMEGVLGHQARYMAARTTGGEIAGVMPLVRVRSRLFGDYLMSMPFLNYGGPIGDDDAVAELTRYARDLARTNGVDLMELRSRTELPVPDDVETNDRKVTVVLDLPDDPEVLWDDFKSKVRSQVRRPMKEDMEARIGLDQIRPFYQVFCEHMRDLGTPVLPFSFFTRALHVFEDDIVFAAVYHENKPVAVGAGFIHGDEFEITWASALWDYSRMAPNMLLYWSLMEEMIKRGVERFNFGRCTPDSGTHRFKSQWGGHDEPLPWAQWSAEGVDATPNPDSPKYQMAVKLWQKLPLAVTNRVGPWLAKKIP